MPRATSPAPRRALGPLFLLLLIGFAACGGGGGGGGNGDEEAVVFAIIATAPAENDVDVSPAAELAAFFSAPADPATVLDTAFDLCSTYRCIPGHASYDGARQAALFQPDEPLPLATSLQATVRGLIASANGTALAQDYTLPFRTRNGAFAAPTPFEGVDRASARVFEINADGKGFVVWHDYTNTTLWATPYDAGLGFGAPFALEDTWTSGFGNPAYLHVGPAGHAVVAWTDQGLFARLYDPLTGWGDIAPLQEAAAGEVPLSVRLGMDGAGNALAAWHLRNFGDSSIPDVHYHAWFDTNVGVWTKAQQTSDPDLDASTAAVVVGAGGERAIVFRQKDKAGHLYAMVEHPITGWEKPQLISAGEEDVISARAAFDPKGTLWVAYVTQALGGTNESQTLRALTRSQGSPSWGTPFDADPVASHIAYLRLDPADDGSVHVIWMRNHFTSQTLMARRYTVSGGWGSVVPISGPSDDFAWNQVATAANARGHIVALWVEPLAASPRSLRAALYAPGAGWSSPATIDPGNLGETAYVWPKAAIDATGNALTVWTRDVDGSGPELAQGWQSRFVAQTGWLPPQRIDANDADAFSEALAVLDRFGRGAILYSTRRGGAGTEYDVWSTLLR